MFNRKSLLNSLFISDTGTLRVAKDLSMEYSYTYTDIEICIRDRRDDNICGIWTVQLSKYTQV